MTDIYDEVDAAGLPPVRKQAALLDETFAITHISDRIEGQAFDDREARDYYIATCFTEDGEIAQYYLAGTAVLDKLAVVERRRAELPVVFTLIKKPTGRGRMYDLVRPNTAAAKSLLRDLQKASLKEVAS